MSKIPPHNMYTLHNREKREKAPFPRPSFILGLLIFIVVGYGFYQFSNYLLTESQMFVLKDIKVKGNRFIHKKQILDLVAIETGVRIFQVSTDDMIKKILKNPYLQGVSITRALPSTLIISVQERQPVAYLVDQKIYMVDQFGKILLKKPEMNLENLPLITGLSVKSLLRDRQPLFDALKLIGIIREVDEGLFSFVSEVHIGRDTPPCLYLIKGGALVELGSDKLHKRIYILSEFLGKASVINQLESFKKINFSYKDRIIVTRKS